MGRFMDAITSPKVLRGGRKSVEEEDVEEEKPKEMTFDLSKLPSEQDRKAVLGCLSQVLAMMYSYEQHHDNDQIESNNNSESDLQVQASGSGSNKQLLDSGTSNGSRRGSRRTSSTSRRSTSTGSSSSSSLEEDENKQTSTTTTHAPSISSAGSLMVHAASLSSPSRRDPTELPRTLSTDSLSPSSRHGETSNLSSVQHEQRVSLFQRRCLKRAAHLLLLDEQHAVALESVFDTEHISGYMDDVAISKYIEPYLESLTNGGQTGFQCLAMLLFRSLIVSGTKSDKNKMQALSKSKKDNDDSNTASSIDAMVENEDDDDFRVFGYDARIRRAFKILSHLILIQYCKEEQQQQHQDDQTSTSLSKDELYRLAARKFEALENDMGNRLVALAEVEQQSQAEEENGIRERQGRQLTTKEKWIRGMKVGGAGLAAGTLFAITGGLAAPAIAAGITSIAGGTALASLATVAVLALQSAAAVTTIFGVGGGGLAAVKMMRRTAGLEEFVIQDKTHPHYISRQLTRNVCISGWIKDSYDFERPWGVTPNNLMNPKELLVRFYSVYEPQKTEADINRMLEDYFGKKAELWKLLREQYGADPNTLLPLHGPRQEAFLSQKENGWVDDMVKGLGFHAFPNYKHETEAVKVVFTDKESKEEVAQKMKHAMKRLPPNQPPLPSPVAPVTPSASSIPATTNENGTNDNKADGAVSSEPSSPEQQEQQQLERSMSAWDFQANYTGELYTVRWESTLLLQIHNSVKDVAKTWATDATKEALKQTMLAGLLTAVAIPSALVKVCNVIDGNWTMTLERADEAGKELAISLLESKSGHRPVTLVGYSFGARVVYSCLLELARHQELWEAQQEAKRTKAAAAAVDGKPPLRQQVSRHMSRRTSSSSSSAAIDIHNYKPNDYLREPASIVEDAILMGAPISLNLDRWLSCRRIVAGRLINGYVPNDLMLRLMFRYQHLSSLFRAPCGTVPIKVPGVENFDLSQYVSWHSDYCSQMRPILNLIGYGQARVSPATTTTADNTTTDTPCIMTPGEEVKTEDMQVPPLEPSTTATADDDDNANEGVIVGSSPQQQRIIPPPPPPRV